MGRRRAHEPLDVCLNGRLTGRLAKERSGAIRFTYDQGWLDWEHAFAVSLSLPLTEQPYAGHAVTAVFDNLLPDNENVRRKVAERTGAEGTDSYSLLGAIGRDCVGAMQFLPGGEPPDAGPGVRGEPVTDGEIERILADLGSTPLGIDPEHEFRISVAGAQEKTALLRQDGAWLRPLGTTPTTHILKPQLGEIPTAFGPIDMAASVDNEHYCLELLREFGLVVAETTITTFGDRRVLVVERFDRRWRSPTQLLRLPQEDFCQALGVNPARKYQNQGGPSATDILRVLQRADHPLENQAAFFKSLILFWLIGATDGHAKNFSIFLRPEGRYGLTPIYDVLSAQPAYDRDQIPRGKYKLAMSAGDSRKYRIGDVSGHHFVETGREAGLGQTIIGKVIREVLERADEAPDRTLVRMPGDFATEIHDSVAAAVRSRLGLLEAGLSGL